MNKFLDNSINNSTYGQPTENMKIKAQNILDYIKKKIEAKDNMLEAKANMLDIYVLDCIHAPTYRSFSLLVLANIKEDITVDNILEIIQKNNLIGDFMKIKDIMGGNLYDSAEEYYL